MKAKLIARVACRTMVGLFAAGALLAGCVSGNSPGTSLAGGPTVPISFGAGSSTNLGTPIQPTGKFDAVAPQTGSFNWTLTSPTETAQSDGTIDCDPSHSTGGRCYTSLSAELGGTAGYSIEIAIKYASGGTIIGLTPTSLAATACDANHANSCIVCTVTAGPVFGATCAGTVPNSDLRLADSAVFVAKTRDYFSSTGGDNVALRFVTYRAPSDFNVANGTVAFAPDAADGTPSSADNLTINTTIVTPDYDLSDNIGGRDNFGDIASAAIAYDVANTSDPMAVYVSTPFTLGLSDTSQKYVNLNFVGMLCSSAADCAEPREKVPPVFRSMGEPVYTAAATNTSMTAIGGTKLAVMKKADNKAYLAEYNAATYTWDEVTGFTSTVVDEIKEVAMYANNATSKVTAVYTTVADGYATVIETSDGVTWSPVGRTAIAIPQFSTTVATDAQGATYVAFIDEPDGFARFMTTNVDGTWVDLVDDSNLKLMDAVTSAFGANYTVTAISNVAIDGSPMVAVTATDGRTSQMAVFGYGLAKTGGYAWAAFSPSIATSAKQIKLAANEAVINQVLVAATAVAWVDENSDIRMATLAGGAWVEADLKDYTATDFVSATAVELDPALATAYMAVKDSNGNLMIIGIDTATAAVSLFGDVETDATSNVSMVVDSVTYTVTVTYMNDTITAVIAKDKSIGLRKGGGTRGGRG